MKCLFILHSPTKAALEKYSLMKKISETAGIVTSPRMSYIDFTKTLAKCEFIVTDGGSNQEESYYFGKPCCILRSETERTEGLGHNVLLSKMDFTSIENFLTDPSKFKTEALPPTDSPSKIIAKTFNSLVTNS